MRETLPFSPRRTTQRGPRKNLRQSKQPTEREAERELLDAAIRAYRAKVQDLAGGGAAWQGVRARRGGKGCRQLHDGLGAH